MRDQLSAKISRHRVAQSGLIRRIVCGAREEIFRVRQNSLTPWLPRLQRGWAAGCRNGAELWRRLRAAGFGGSLRVVGEWAARQRRAETAELSGSGKCPPAPRIERLMTSARYHLSKADAVLVVQIESALSALAIARKLTDRFSDMVRNVTADGLAAWLDEAEGSEVAAFARGLRVDQAAVLAALQEP